jgi:hypothetical protein
MDGGNEQGVAIKCCFKAGVSATEQRYWCKRLLWMSLWTHQSFRWYSRFGNGRELVKNDEKCGRPKSIRTEVNIAVVSNLFKNDRLIASRMIAESLNIPKSVVLRILKDIWERKICVYVSFHIPWHLSEGKIEPQLAKTLSRRPMQTNIL